MIVHHKATIKLLHHCTFCVASIIASINQHHHFCGIVSIGDCGRRLIHARSRAGWYLNVSVGALVEQQLQYLLAASAPASSSSFITCSWPPYKAAWSALP